MMSSLTVFDFGQGPVPAHQHPNGGGWVADTACVGKNAFVDSSSMVYETARVLDYALVSGGSRVHGRALLTDYSYVIDQGEVAGETQLHGHECVEGPAPVVKKG